MALSASFLRLLTVLMLLKVSVQTYGYTNVVESIINLWRL